MNTVKVLGVLIFSFVLLAICGVADGTGYSPYINSKIWSLRKIASSRAELGASQVCGWSPPDSVTFDDNDTNLDQVADPTLAKSLMKMLRLDQNARAVFMSLGTRKSKIKAQEVDSSNLVQLRRILRKGFPTTHAVGFAASNAALILVIHADSDLKLQKSALMMLRVEAKSGAVPLSFPLVLETVRKGILGVGSVKKKRIASEQPATITKVKEHGSECFTRIYTAKLYENYKRLFSAANLYRNPHG